jgi:hypothetical protein
MDMKMEGLDVVVDKLQLLALQVEGMREFDGCCKPLREKSWGLRQTQA